MTYDGTDANDDGVVEADVDNQSVSADHADTETLTRDFEDNWPPVVSQPTADGPPRYGPYPNSSNPILTPDDITAQEDFEADFAADPFSVYDGGDWHIFFEVRTTADPPDFYIGHAILEFNTGSIDANYQGTVVGPRPADGYDGALNYSFVWKDSGRWLMMDHTDGDRLLIREADTFPDGPWTVVNEFTAANPVYGDPTPILADPEVHDWYSGTQRRYIIVSHNSEASPEERLVWFADTDDLTTASTLTPHDQNPVVSGGSYAKNAGRPKVTTDHIRLFTRKGATTDDVHAVYTDRWTDLSPSSISRDEEGIVGRAHGFSAWDQNSKHHIDPAISQFGQQDIVLVDGTDTDDRFSIGAYTTVDHKPFPATFDASGQSGIPTNTEVLLNNTPFVDWTGVAASNNRLYVVQADGIYDVSANIQYSGLSGGEELYLRIKKNDSEIIGQSVTFASQNATRQTLTVPSRRVRLQEGDEIGFYAVSDTSVDVSGTPERSYMSIDKVVDV